MTSVVVPADQLKKLLSKTDQMLSQHAYLRDCYKLRSDIIDFGIMICSLILSVLVFSGPNFLHQFFGEVKNAQIIMGLVSLAVLILSIFNWKVDWKKTENSHASSCKILSDLKLKLRSLLGVMHEISQQEYEQGQEIYNRSLEQCCPIPENKFHKTKLHHNKKVALSKAIDDSPGTSLWIIKIKLWCRDTFN